jgi:hypothetical protein
MAAVGLAVAIPVTLLIRGGDSDSGTVAVTTSSATIPNLKSKTASDAALGMEIGVPAGWTAAEGAKGIQLKSGDGTTEVVVSAPAPAGATTDVLKTAVNAIQQNYSDASGIPNAGGELAGKEVGGLHAQSAALVARTKGGTPLRIIVSAASGDAHTYQVEVFNALASSAARLTEAQTALNSLKLTG